MHVAHVGTLSTRVLRYNTCAYCCPRDWASNTRGGPFYTCSALSYVFLLFPTCLGTCCTRVQLLVAPSDSDKWFRSFHSARWVRPQLDLLETFLPNLTVFFVTNDSFSEEDGSWIFARRVIRQNCSSPSYFLTSRTMGSERDPRARWGSGPWMTFRSVLHIAAAWNINYHWERFLLQMHAKETMYLL